MKQRRKWTCSRRCVYARSIIIAFVFAFFFPPSWVAAGAVLEIGDALFTVFVLDVATVVLVASVACVGGQCVGMADRTLADSTFAVIEWEAVSPVVGGG
jgi:hypothetical protein